MLLLAGCGVMPNPGVSPLLPGAPNEINIVLGMMMEAGLLTILALVALNLVLGIAVAIRKEVFEWKKLGDFYRKYVLPDVLGYIGVYAIDMLMPDLMPEFVMTGVVTAAFVAVTSKLVAKIMIHINELGWEKGIE